MVIPIEQVLMELPIIEVRNEHVLVICKKALSKTKELIPLERYVQLIPVTVTVVIDGKMNMKSRTVTMDSVTTDVPIAAV